MFINCDIGESYGPWEKGADATVMPLIDWANIACGAHAGDPDTMARTLELAVEHHVTPGAHPGYPDRRNFGRLRLDWPTDSMVREVQAQIGGLAAVARAVGVPIRHVKPHGALYLAMMLDDNLLVALADGVAAVDDSLVFVLQATPDRERHAEMLAHTGLALAFEAFADRAYSHTGHLVPRSVEGALLTDPERIASQALGLVEGWVETTEGELAVDADTTCIHGDNPAAPEALRLIREKLPAG